MQSIPIQPVANQTLQTNVDGQNVTINLYAKNAQGVFADVISNGTTLINGVLCLDADPIVPTEYLGFLGNFIFVDTQGNSNPEFSGFGSRFQLVYLTASEYALTRQ